jgi:hypothetical protein
MDKDLKISEMEDRIEELKMLLESSESVKEGEKGMNQNLKQQIQSMQTYINELIRLNNSYVTKIGQLKGDIQVLIERR